MFINERILDFIFKMQSSKLLFKMTDADEITIKIEKEKSLN